MSELLLTLIPMLPSLLRAGYDLYDSVKNAIDDAPAEDRAAIDAAWDAIADDLDSALADYNAAKKGD